MNCRKEYMQLYAVTDRTWVGEQTLLEQVEAALKGGVTCVQLREKELDEEAFLEEAMEMKVLCEKYHVPFIINDNVEIAIKCKADGIHVGQKDMEAGNVRKLVGDDMMIGVSARTVEQALKAQEAGADYLGVGAMFTTTTKLDANQVSFETLNAICEAVTIPVVAIGGISKANMLELAGSGADGVALVSAIFAAEDIEEECRELGTLSRKMSGC
ncbi:MAG: thiamine phosphate synthase [Ruminococcus sp.]|nr:thiamine phosphate synthase [Ruminococcus sp.]